MRTGRIRRYGGRHGHFLAEDLNRLRGVPIDAAELTFAEHQHQKEATARSPRNQPEW